MSSGSPKATLDHRPLKRPRNQAPEEVINAPVDHIFIADGVSAKKSGAKKTPLSCCECRRLKLKCDRNFPCASCKKRGCAEICPDGVLVSGKGTRFILANTEQLHFKIHEMSERIRDLEEALGSLHRVHDGCLRKPSNPFYSSTAHNELDNDEDAENGIQPHPLLAPNLLIVKSTMGLYTGAGGNPTNNSKEESSRTVGREGENPKQKAGRQGMEVDFPSDRERGSSEDTVMVAEVAVGEKSTLEKDSQEQAQDLAAQIVRLSHAFPLSSSIWIPPPSTPSVGGDPTAASTKEIPTNLALREYIRSQLPPRDEAEYLWGQARRNALWQYNPHPSPTFFPNLAHHVYFSPVNELCSRRLALFFMILAVGCNVDLNEDRERSIRNIHLPKANLRQESDIENPLAETYHQLARASLCEIPIMEETNVDVILALFWEVWYLLVFSDRKKAAAYAWGIMGLTAKLAQSIGLHRNGGKSKVIPEEVEKRRALFWELLYLDARLSLSLGRPPSLSINHMDCQRPTYMPDEGVEVKDSLHHYQDWKHSCYINCLSPVLDAISQPTINLEYNTVLDLDRRIRDFAIPEYLRRGIGNDSRSLVMQKGSLCTALEAVLLQLHRTFFTRALSGFDEAFNRRHKYAPSVVAVFLSASRMIATVQDLYRREPQLTSRILGYWSNAFSSAVALCLLVSRAPFTCLSPAALQELERARILFRSAKETCPRALQVIPILETMVDKANDIYNRWCNGQEVTTIVLRHINDDANAAGTKNDTGYAGYQQPLDSYQSVSQQPQYQQFEQQRHSYQQHEITYQQHMQQQQQQQQQERPDPFVNAHSSLAQCIVEVHQRAKLLFPLRKPCMCSASVAKSCPPSHSWSPPPKIPQHQQTSPVLPPEAPLVVPASAYANGGMNSAYSTPSPYHRGRTLQGGYDNNPGYGGGMGLAPSALGEGLYSSTVLPSDGAAIPLPPPMSTLSPASKMAVVDTLNFELGALNVNTEHNWMAFF